jgi:hypothetical protein
VGHLPAEKCTKWMCSKVAAKQHQAVLHSALCTHPAFLGVGACQGAQSQVVVAPCLGVGAPCQGGGAPWRGGGGPNMPGGGGPPGKPLQQHSIAQHSMARNRSTLDSTGWRVHVCQSSFAWCHVAA